MTPRLAPVRRRVWRFFSVLTAGRWAARVDGEPLAAYLSPPQRLLFERMQPADQQHSLKVFASLWRAGYRDPDLLQAALLHDVGKARASLRLWHRVAFDLGETFWPGALRWLAAHGPAGTRHAFTVALRHPELGASDALGAGCSDRVVALIRGDARPDLVDLAEALRRHDSAE